MNKRQSFGAENVARLQLGDEVQISYGEGGREIATVSGFAEHRPHVVKVTYARSRTAAWVHGSRIVGVVRNV